MASAVGSADTTSPQPASAIPREVAEGVMLPYRTFITTTAKLSLIPGAGTGLFAVDAMPRFTWICFYPGKVSVRE